MKPPRNGNPAYPHKFKTLEKVKGLTLPFGEDRMKPKHSLVRRKFVRNPQALYEDIVSHIQGQGGDWAEFVTESQDQVILDLFPSDITWLFQMFEEKILDLNAKHFGLDLTYWHVMRLNRYRAGAEKGHRLHSDYVGPEPAKLAFSIPLVQAEEGGTMGTNQEGDVDLAPGDLLLFPAYEAHYVNAVTKGERVSLTGWLGGPALR